MICFIFAYFLSFTIKAVIAIIVLVQFCVAGYLAFLDWPV